MKTRHARPTSFVAAVLTLLMLAAGCSNKSVSGGGESAGGSSAVAEVTATKVSRVDLRAALSVTGTITALPNQDVRVSSLVPGRVAQIFVAEGDHVGESQIIAKIDDRPYQDQAVQAEAGVAQARANLENARLNRERNETLFKRGIAAGKELEDARTQFSVSEAALRQSEAALALAKLQLARTEVKSPLGGTAVKRLVSVGEQVDGTAAQPLFQVANVSQVELFGNVPAVYLNKIRVGQLLELATEAVPGKKLAGRVVAISPAVDPNTNLGLVRIRLTNEHSALRLGMFLTAEVPLETRAGVLAVPPQAVYKDEEGQLHVYRIRGDSAEAVPVKLGLETHDWVELLSGVQEGETVILAGGYGLGDKTKVKIKP